MLINHENVEISKILDYEGRTTELSGNTHPLEMCDTIAVQSQRQTDNITEAQPTALLPCSRQNLAFIRSHSGCPTGYH